MTTSPGGRGPLSDIVVVDFTRVLAGPTATMILGDLGATILKIEDPETGDSTRTNMPFVKSESHYFLSINRNKRSVCLNLKGPVGKQAAIDLAASADVVIENFRPGVMDRLGLSYPELAAINKRLIYCSISGFGQSGPLREKASYDIVTQAMTGVMSVNGPADGPPTKLGLPMGDISGGLMAVIAILTALEERSRTGDGRFIDISLQDSLMYLLGYFSGLYFTTGESAGRFGSSHHNIVPYGAFPARDGHVVIAAFNQGFWAKLCAALDAPELISDPRFATYADRYANRDACDEAISSRTSLFKVRELCALLDTSDVPNAPVLSVGEALEHPQAEARNMVVEVSHPTVGPLRVLGHPFKFSGFASSGVFEPPPLLGEDTVSVLESHLGYGTDLIARVIDENKEYE